MVGLIDWSLLPVQLFHDFCHFSDISFVTRGSSSEAGVTEKTHRMAWWSSQLAILIAVSNCAYSCWNARKLVTFKTRRPVNRAHTSAMAQQSPLITIKQIQSKTYHVPPFHLFRTVSDRDKLRFLSNIRKFSHPMYLTPWLKRFPLKLCCAGWASRTEMMALPDVEKV